MQKPKVFFEQRYKDNLTTIESNAKQNDDTSDETSRWFEDVFA